MTKKKKNDSSNSRVQLLELQLDEKNREISSLKSTRSFYVIVIVVTLSLFNIIGGVNNAIVFPETFDYTMLDLRKTQTIIPYNNDKNKIINKENGNDKVDNEKKDLKMKPGSSDPPLTVMEQDEWIRSNFRAAEPVMQDWCMRALLHGNFFHQKPYHGGAQHSQDVFMARNIFFEKFIYNNTTSRGFFVEAGANDYKHLSTSYFFEKCLGWEGLCVEPQKRYHKDLIQHRSCTLVPMCMTKDRSTMMIGGLPSHRGAGMFIRPLPKDGNLPQTKDFKNRTIFWEKVSCAPLKEILKEFSPGGETTHVDLFTLDVEGAELPVLDTIKWGDNSSNNNGVTFSVLQIEVGKMVPKVRKQLTRDMNERGYEGAYVSDIDYYFVPQGYGKAGMYASMDRMWNPYKKFSYPITKSFKALI